MTTSTARNPLSFAHLAALEVGPPELIDLVAEAGFASTSLRMIPTVPAGPAYPLDNRAQRRATRNRVTATGVHVLYIEVVSLSQLLDVPTLEPLFEAGADVGATRVLATGDDADFAVVADKLAAVCELGRQFDLAIDVEFMPFRAVRTLADAVDVIDRAGATNAHVLVDALHFYRSNSSLDQLRHLDRRLLGTFQICDGVRNAPVDLAYEARNARLLPGRGELRLIELLNVLPVDLPMGVEVPMALSHPELDLSERLELMLAETRTFMSRTSN